MNTLFNHSIIFLDEDTTSLDEDSADDKKPTAYFISLVATSLRGIPAKEHYLYDIATEMELQGFRVKFLSSKELKEFYLKHHPGFDEKKVNIYDIALFLLQKHKGSSFFFDEVPFIAIRNEYGYGKKRVLIFEIICSISILLL